MDEILGSVKISLDSQSAKKVEDDIDKILVPPSGPKEIKISINKKSLEDKIKKIEGTRSKLHTGSYTDQIEFMRWRQRENLNERNRKNEENRKTVGGSGNRGNGGGGGSKEPAFGPDFPLGGGTGGGKLDPSKLGGSKWKDFLSSLKNGLKNLIPTLATSTAAMKRFLSESAIVFVVGLATKAIEEFATKVRELHSAFKAGEISRGQFVKETARSLPVLGNFISMWDAILGKQDVPTRAETQGVERAEEEIKAQETLLKLKLKAAMAEAELKDSRDPRSIAAAIEQINQEYEENLKSLRGMNILFADEAELAAKAIRDAKTRVVLEEKINKAVLLEYESAQKLEEAERASFIEKKKEFESLQTEVRSSTRSIAVQFQTWSNSISDSKIELSKLDDTLKGKLRTTLLQINKDQRDGLQGINEQQEEMQEKVKEQIEAEKKLALLRLGTGGASPASILLKMQSAQAIMARSANDLQRGLQQVAEKANDAGVSIEKMAEKLREAAGIQMQLEKVLNTRKPIDESTFNQNLRNTHAIGVGVSVSAKRSPELMELLRMNRQLGQLINVLRQRLIGLAK